MSFPDWLDTREDVTWEEFAMREIHFPIEKYVDIPLALVDEAIDLALEDDYFEDLDDEPKDRSR